MARPCRAGATYRFLRVTFGQGQVMSDSHLLGTLFDITLHQLEWRVLAGSIGGQGPYGPFSCEVELDGLS